MKNKMKMQDGFRFLLMPLAAGLMEAKKEIGTFWPVELPHDWLIGEPMKLNTQVSEAGWYYKTFDITKEKNREWILHFDGVYMNSTVYVNDTKVGSWPNGYTCFSFNITEALQEGENELFVQVRYETPNSRWYSGAGIYRSVWLTERDVSHIEENGIYITTKEEENGAFQITVSSEVQTENEATLRHQIYRYGTDEPVGEEISCKLPPSPEITTYTKEWIVESPCKWELENPTLYELRTTLEMEGEIIDWAVTRFGFRTVFFSPDKGFFLNGKRVKLKGVCEHHDLGCLGSAFYEDAMKRKFVLLQKMGANAVRISHNMPSIETVRLADEMGILLITELYDMWERPKNTYDFARFFHESYKQDVAAWVRRDRNSPSILMWSIGNEIYDTHISERGTELTRLLAEEVRKHDPKEHAKVTLASNYMPWEHAQSCADIVKLAGYNYGEKYYKAHHVEHPDWVIYGSETASVVQSRGIYHFPRELEVLTDDDSQCSSLGNSITSWGAASAEACILEERDNDFSCGQFIWAGFDYIGEPTPYHTKNSFFGQLDTAGFPKDAYYLYQSAWTDVQKSPMLHLFPYWDFNEGQEVDVGVYTNAPVVELFCNGISRGKKYIDHKNGTVLSAWWKLTYETGIIQAVAYDERGEVIATKQRRSFTDASKIILTPDKENPKTGELIFVTITMEDEKGNPVENANNRVSIIVEGSGKLLGLDNGDSTDYDSYQAADKRLFSGKLLAVVQRTQPGECIVKASASGMQTTMLLLNEDGTWLNTEAEETTERKTQEIPVRKIELKSAKGRSLTGQMREVEIEAYLHPANATDEKVRWRVTDEKGIDAGNAKIYPDGKKARLQALGDGTCVVRCMTCNGREGVSLLSQLSFHITGMGSLCLNPYEFLSAGLYTYKKGNLGNGNERGVATARDGETQVGFEQLDFGPYGSDEITIPIFALTGEPYTIQIWEGIPGESASIMLADVIYQKKSIWNVYQEETYQLCKRLKGITTICFVLRQKVHIKGFSFARQSRAFERLYLANADRIYGDRFVKEEKWVKNIGNNVSLEWKQMDFGTKGAKGIILCGSSRQKENSIHLCMMGEGEERKELLEFAGTGEETEQTFNFDPIYGEKDLTFLFLPGSDFDFHWIQFIT